MNRISIIFLLLIPILLAAQSNEFEYIQYDTLSEENQAFVVLHGDIFSLSTSAQNITVTPIERSKPEGWQAYYCLRNVCLPLEFVPSYTFELAGGDTSIFSLDVQTADIPGDGEWTIMVVDSSTMEIDSARVRVSFMTSSIDPGFNIPENFKISSVYPNPVNAQVNIALSIEEAGIYTVELISLTGRTVMEREYSLSPGANLFSWNMEGLNSGNYVLSVEHENQIHTRKVIIIK